MHPHMLHCISNRLGNSWGRYGEFFRITPHGEFLLNPSYEQLVGKGECVGEFTFLTFSFARQLISSCASTTEVSDSDITSTSRFSI